MATVMTAPKFSARSRDKTSKYFNAGAFDQFRWGSKGKGDKETQRNELAKSNPLSTQATRRANAVVLGNCSRIVPKYMQRNDALVGIFAVRSSPVRQSTIRYVKGLRMEVR